MARNTQLPQALRKGIMSSDINLVAGDLGGASGGAKRLSTLRMIATSLIVGVGLVSILLFALNRLFSPQQIIKEQDGVRASISALQDKQAKLSVLNQRLSDIGNLLSKRAAYDIVLQSILSKSPSEISIVSLTIDKQKISMVASSNSLLSINEFIDVLAGMVEEKEFLENVTINSLSLSSRASSYTMTLELTLL